MSDLRGCRWSEQSVCNVLRDRRVAYKDREKVAVSEERRGERVCNAGSEVVIDVAWCLLVAPALSPGQRDSG